MAGSPYTSASREPLLEDLNEAQRQAVTHTGSPLLVVAGAGTGKTRVLTRRVAWLVAGGLPARSVLAITFTNKAAQVLRQRLGRLPGGGASWSGTFHALAARILRADGERIGIDSAFTVLDREDQLRLLRDLLKDLGPRAAGLKPAPVAAMIGHVKNRGVARPPLDLSNAEVAEAFGEVADRYRRRLRAGQVLDFDDLLLEALRLLEEDEAAGTAWRRRFAHVLVDEYQDTNRVQADLLRALVAADAGITVVGDPDQSIYRWRGAAVRNILGFTEDFPGARTVLLERNYRSTAQILEAAEHVIARNTERHAKRLHTEREAGAAIRVVRCRDADDESQVVADVIEAWAREGRPWHDIAVFYRVNALSRALEMSLRSRRVPYVVVAGVEFFQRREVKDLLAYARLVENPDDEAAFLRVANVPRRGVGETSLARLRHAALDEGVSLMDAARRGLGEVSGRARGGLASLVALIEDARQEPRAPVAPLLDRLATTSGYRDWLESQDEDLTRSRIENVDELIAYARQVDETEEGVTLREFLERAALVSDQDAVEEEGGRVNLMSVHAAKGLEFPCVVIVGAETGHFPHARSADTPGEVEEERRLFYVAMTRAMDRLVITHASRRFQFRGDEPRLPSPFLADVPSAVVEREDRVGGRAGTGSLGWGDIAHDDADVVRESDVALAVGDRVRHPYFGPGRLEGLHGRGGEMRATVDFEAHGRKQLLLSHARLERLG